MNDPSDGVPPQLLKHVHCVSTFAFPTSANIQLPTIVDRLLAAPGIAHDVKPMVWMYIDAPRDGMMMLVWQPLAKMGTEFASDGYVWADPESAFSSEVKGHTVEMYLHRSGYRYGEPVATHQRRRYRLLPGPNANPSQPQPDPALWIIHYSQAEAAHRIAVNQIPMTPFVNSTLTSRKYLQQHGQIIRKEFMLHDRPNWPTINLPGNTAGPQATAYPNNVISHMSRQQPGYAHPAATAAANQAGIGPPAAKRARPNNANVPDTETAILQAVPNSEPTIYDEEDVSRGDMLDFLTPREISAVRYKQHHEWLGEIFRSPYDTQQIVPGELGIGRKGELEVLTRDFFNAPTKASSRATSENIRDGLLPPPPRVGRMEPGKADEFTKLANDRISGINAEIEKMRRQHAKRMAKLAKGAEVRDAEKALRTANINAESITSGGHGIERANLDGRESEYAAIRARVEGTLGKKVGKVTDVVCIENGRLVEKVNESDSASQDFDFPDQVGDLSGQIPNFQTPQDHLSSMEGTPGPSTNQSGTLNAAPNVNEGQGVTQGADVVMSGMQNEAGTEKSEAEEWVIVNKGSNDEGPDGGNEELPDLDAFTNDVALGSNLGTPGEHIGTTGGDLADFTTGGEGELSTDFNADEFTAGVDFGNLDTAGEALSGYGAEESMGIDDPADLGLDDTAFGDAFHAASGRDDNELAGS
ncbi:MAG: hypothetical protein Q9223_007186 [Gallowayella weberi]